MARLIVRENGESRTYRLGEGRLSIGSGEAARLRLVSPDVAEVHAELEFVGGRIHLRARPGVLPPEVHGAPIEGEAPLGFGQEFRIGGAVLHVERDVQEATLEPEAPAAAALAPAAAPAPASRQTARRPGSRTPARAAAPAPGRASSAASGGPVAARSSRVAAARRAARARERGDDFEGEERGPRRRQPEGLPTWFVVLLISAVGIIAGLILLFLVGKGASTTPNAVVQLELATVAYREDRIGDIAGFLDKIPADAELSPAERERLDELRDKVEEFEEQSRVYEDIRRGTNYLDAKLKRYEEKQLQGSPPAKKVRLFLKRCRYFRERWPTHPELDWIRRQETRFEGVVDLSAPPSWEDVDWEVQYLVPEKGKPKDWKAAEALLADFSATASDEDRRRVQMLLLELDQRRVEHFTDQLNQARYEFDEKNSPSRATEILAQLVMRIGDPQMEDEAAVYFVEVQRELERRLKGSNLLAAYKDGRNDDYRRLIENPKVRALADEFGL